MLYNPLAANLEVPQHCLAMFCVAYFSFHNFTFSKILNLNVYLYTQFISQCSFFCIHTYIHTYIMDKGVELVLGHVWKSENNGGIPLFEWVTGTALRQSGLEVNVFAC